MSGRLITAIVVAIAGFALVPGAAEAQTRTITCESQGDRRETCRVPDLNQQSVRLTRRMSDAACINGRTWGTDRNEIWVTAGCRAEFTYDIRNSGGGGNNYGRQNLTCESQNDRRETCRIDGLNQQSVRLERTLSSAMCVNGRSWGTQNNAIWVTNGCRAEFSYTSSGGGYGGGNSARREVTCESRNGDLRNCRAPGLNERSVRLERTLSSTACINGRTWGTQPNIIWVESGCRGVFTYTVGGGGSSQADNPNARHEITCESRNDARRSCRINNLDLGSVRIERVLSSSPCNLDDSWGRSRGEIWVSRGCRAVFSYRINN